MAEELDAETLAFAQRTSDLARDGRTGEPSALATAQFFDQEDMTAQLRGEATPDR